MSSSFLNDVISRIVTRLSFLIEEFFSAIVKIFCSINDLRLLVGVVSTYSVRRGTHSIKIIMKSYDFSTRHDLAFMNLRNWLL